MAAVYFDLGIKKENGIIIGVDSFDDWHIRLFTNPSTISHTNITSDFTPPSVVTFPAYSDAVLNPIDWVTSYTYPLVTSVYPTLSFVFGAYLGTVTIYGYIVTYGSGGTAFFGEVFSVPFVVPNIGATFDLDLTFEHEQCP